MGSVLLVLAAVLFIAAIVVFIAALRRPKKPSGGREDPLAFTAAAPQFGPRQLGPGAIVSHGGVDYVVRGSVTYREGPFVWWEHLLEGGDEPIWFSVEDDDGRLKLAMWTSRKELQLEPGGQHVVDGVTYHEVGARSRRLHHRGHDGPARRRRHGLRRLHQRRRDRAAVLRALGAEHAVGGLHRQVRADRRAHRLPGPAAVGVGPRQCHFISCR